MVYRYCWTILLLPLSIAFMQQEPTSPCGIPSVYGGQSIQAYLNNTSEKLVLPWTVAIKNTIGTFKCLGSIIPDIRPVDKQSNSSTLILTAGSCFRRSLKKNWGSPSHYKVYAGLDRVRLFLNDGVKTKPVAIRIMPYNAVNENIWNGVAMVTLKKPIVFNKYISPVCLASSNALPADASVCFVSTYHKRKLDEENVRMVLGSTCKFGQFPELANLNGLCSHHERADTEKSLGGPLVCLVNGRAVQYGVYLSQLVTKKALSSHKQALHFYGHVSAVTDTDPSTASKIIQLGSISQSSKQSSSSGGSESKGKEDCTPPPATTPGPGPVKPTPPHCGKPTKPNQVTPPSKPAPVICGDTSSFGRQAESYVIGNDAQDVLPWNVIITTRITGSTRCIGSLVHRGDEQQIVNGSDVVITAADCFSRYTHASESGKSKLRVYAGTPRFSRFRRRGVKSKIASVRLYGLPWGEKQTRPGIAILKLERPLFRKDNVAPVCLAPQGAVPPPYASCYVTHYDKRENSIDEEVVILTRNARCLAAAEEKPNGADYRGICAMDESKKHYVQLGSPLVCIVKGRVYQYGVYLNQLSLKINDRVKQHLGFYTEINIVHDIFAGKQVKTLGERVPHQPVAKPQQPDHPLSSSSSSSEETNRLPVQHVPEVLPSYPSHPLPTIKPVDESLSKSSSDSASEITATSDEQTTDAESHEESVESHQSLLTIRLYVKVIKPWLPNWKIKDNRKPAVRPENSSGLESSEVWKPRPLPPRPSGPGSVICPIPGQRPVEPLPGSLPNNVDGIQICPLPGSNTNAVPLPTPLPNAEYPSSSLENVGKVILPSLPKYDMSNKTIATHEHILVRDKVIGEGAIAGGVTSGFASIGMAGEMHSLLPGKSSGEIVGNDMTSEIPGVSGSFATGSSAMGNSGGHLDQQLSRLPGASGVHILIVSGSSIEALCTGTLYVRTGEIYSDEVVTASRCVKSMTADKYRVYIGSLLPRKMAVDQLNKTFIEVGGIFTTPFYAEYNELKEMGMTVLKLKHRVKVVQGVQSFPLPYSTTLASPKMECYISGVCQHGMPVRVAYQLLSPTECANRLGKEFLPNTMYCGVGQKEILQYPVGSPLLCQSAGEWTQFGIYDHTVRTAAVRRVDNKEVPEQNELALFMKLEGGDVARVQER